MTRPTTVADLRRMLDDFPDHYPVLVDLEQNTAEIVEWVNDEDAYDDDELPFLTIDALALGGSSNAYVAITGRLQ